MSNAPWAASGYGNQTALFVPKIKQLGHDIAVLAFFGLEGAILDWNGIRVYPKHLEVYGQDISAAHAQHFNADCIVTLIDAWVMRPEFYQGFPWFPWAPIDMDPAPPPVVDKLRVAARPIAYARYGEAKMREAGLDPLYVPHGIDTRTFCPGDRAGSRRTLRWPEDRFVVGIVAANKGWPDRKCLQQQIAAFARFKARHPDALLYLHTTVAENGEYGGLNIVRCLADAGLKPGSDYSFASQYLMFIGGYGQDYLRTVYNALDVLLNVSMGEGFGIPILEAQASGCPVITGDWTAQSELCFGGWKVRIDEAEPFTMPLFAKQWIPHVDAIEDRLELAYLMAHEYPDRWDGLKRQAREGALAYDADRVVEQYWTPALEVMGTMAREKKAPQLVAGPLAA